MSASAMSKLLAGMVLESHSSGQTLVKADASSSMQDMNPHLLVVHMFSQHMLQYSVE